MKALVIDDEVLARKRILNLLREVPEIQVQGEYSNGQTAITAINSTRPDLLFLDISMKDMNGFEVLEWVRKDPRCRRMVVHVMSASSRESDIHKAYELHASSYVIKPSRIDELVRFVTALAQWHHFVALPHCE